MVNYKISEFSKFQRDFDAVAWDTGVMTGETFFVFSWESWRRSKIFKSTLFLPITKYEILHCKIYFYQKIKISCFILINLKCKNLLPSWTSLNTLICDFPRWVCSWIQIIFTLSNRCGSDSWFAIGVIFSCTCSSALPVTLDTLINLWKNLKSGFISFRQHRS